MASVKPKKELPLLTPKPGSELSALSWSASADPELTAEARSKLLELDRVLSGEGVKGTLTSGRRKPDGTKSHHHHGNAVDIVLPGGTAEMEKAAGRLQELGYRAQFERKGQRNPNGSVATGDHIHITLFGGAAKPKASSFASAFENAGKVATKEAASSFASAFEAAGAKTPTAKPSSSFASAFENAGKPKTKAGASSFASSFEAAGAKRSTAKPKKYGPLDYIGSLSNAYNAYLNELARQGRDNVPALNEDFLGAMRATPGAVGAALAAGRQAFGPEAVPPQHFRIKFGMKEGETGRAAYNTASALDYLSSFGTDPTNVVAGPIMKGLGKLAAPVTRPLGRVAEGGRAQAAAQAAARKVAALETEYASAKAGGAGAAKMRKLGTELAQARAAAASAVQTAEQLAQGSRAARLGVAGAKTPAARGVMALEQGAAAHMAQTGTKATKARRAAVGHIKGALLSNIGTAASNIGGNAVMAEHALREAGVPIASFVARLKGSKAALDAYKAGQATGDLAELVQLAPGILDTPAVIGGRAGAQIKNPLLKVQQQADEMAKVTLFSALKPVLGPEAAAQRVKTLLFDYSDVPAVLKLLDREGLLLFGSFGYASSRAMADAILRRPDLIARYPRLQQQLLKEFPGSEEGYKKLRGYQRNPLALPTGENTFVDLSRYHPLGQALDLIGGERGENRPPLAVDVLGKTAAGPTVRALDKAGRAKGAPPAEQWRTVVRETLAGHLPQYRDYLRWRAALEGTTRSDWKSEEPQTVRQAALQSVGVTSAKGELEHERRKRVSPKIEKRHGAGAAYVGALDLALQTGKLKNPYVSKAQNFDEAKRELRDARRYLRDMIVSPQNITAEGKITPNGRARIRNAYLRALALRRRFKELAGELD